MRYKLALLGLVGICLAGCHSYHGHNGPDRATRGIGLSQCLRLQRLIFTGHRQGHNLGRRINAATRARLLQEYHRFNCDQVYDIDSTNDITIPPKK